MVETQTQRKYYSINSFMKAIIEKESPDSQVEFIDLYFIPGQAFRNQFNSTSIKPTAMLIKLKSTQSNLGVAKQSRPAFRGSDGPETLKPVKSLKYADMIAYLGHTPIVSFKANGDRRIYKKQAMQKLVIKNILKDYQDRQYYDSKIITVNDNTVIDKIKADIPDKTSTIDIYDSDVELFE